MKRLIYLLPAFALYLASCSDDTITPGNSDELGNENVEQITLKTANLASFKSSQSRVNVIGTRAYPNPGELTLFATIDNLSKEGKITGFEKEGNDGRYLSATCVYYDKNTGKYYVTYHMQGNNYNTKQTDETSGYIETFTLDAEGKPTVDKVYMSEDPSKLDFDFNHLYFDDLSNSDNSGVYKGTDNGTRIIAVGHKSEPSKKEGGEPNTAAIIAKLNLEEGKIDYSTVLTGEKITDESVTKDDGTLMPLGDEDAGDVNCVLRKYDYYYLATRKGIAVLNARNDKDLFSPINNVSTEDYKPIENTTYFVRTPGSAKHLCHYYPVYGSGFSFLYMTQPFPETYDGETALPASIINFSMNAGDGTLCGMNTSGGGAAIYNTSGFDITTWSLGTNQFKTDGNICPIDGKNVLANLNGILYACLGKGGLYISGPSEKTIKFSDKKDGTGSRPVNGVFVEDLENYNDGFIYVANGACLTILDRKTLEKVAEYSAFEEGDASANYVTVYKTDTYTGKCPDRLITVAYGQAGVKIFKFTPPSR
ncbi:MAG: hypothetical protein J1F10_01275 [Muribaculaceae bacterium]|nr:hypothetical protein [Muribaculaceae bacterium]